MKRREFLKALKDAEIIYGYVRLTEEQGEYLKLDAKDVREVLPAGNDTEMSARFNTGGHGTKVLVIG